MAQPTVDVYCPQFQPNTFDPSRCRSCLRPDHMHLSSNAAISAPQQGGPQEWEADEDICALSEVTTSPSSDDVSGSWAYEWSLVHSLSPEWELNISHANIQPSSVNQFDCLERSRSFSPESFCRAQNDMTQLDPSPNGRNKRSWMDERRGRSRRASESRQGREKESGYFSPDRRGNGEQQVEEVGKGPYRYFEKGHPLPSNYVLEPKACVPYRNVNLGIPSQRRNLETYMQEAWRSESPERYTYHSNFRRGTDTQGNSPTRHGSVSPDRYKINETERRAPSFRSQGRSHSTSHSSSHLPSNGPSRHTSGRSSPSRRRGSVASRTASPSKRSVSQNTDSLHSQNGKFNAERRNSQMLRSPSQASNKHSLDSEKLYRNLESISHRGSSTPQRDSFEGSQSSPARTAVNSLQNTRSYNSREISPSRNGYSTQSHTPQRESSSRDSRLSPSQGSWQGSSHSFLNLPLSRGSSTSRLVAGSQAVSGPQLDAAVTETDKGIHMSNRVSGERSTSTRRGMEALLMAEPKRAAVETEEAGMTMDDYIILADIPKIQLESEEELPGLRWRNQSPSPCREQKTRTYRYQDEIDISHLRPESDERGRGRERGRDRREKCRDFEIGRSSRRHSNTSLQSSENHSGKCRSSKMKERPSSECQQTQGWMSRQDERGKWKKHWFVLSDTSLRYYRDSEAEESDDLDGEIDLTSCVNVSECDVENKYGLQIQTKKAVFTLATTTSRTRHNWVKLLRQTIQENMHQSDSGNEKENPLCQRLSPSQPHAQFAYEDSRYEPSTSTSAENHQADHRHHAAAEDLEVGLSPAGQREEGEGWDREQAKRLEERNKWFEEGVPVNEMGSRWDSMELKRGSVPAPVIETMDSEVSKKWAELEKLSFRDMSAQSLIGAQSNQPSIQRVSQSLSKAEVYQSSPEDDKQLVSVPEMDTSSPNGAPSSINGTQAMQTNTAKTLQREAFSLRKQVENIKMEHAEMGIEVDSPCCPGAPCRAKLKAMEVAHQKTLHELREKHAKEIRELEEQRDRMLEEEKESAARAMDALRITHREELEREVEEVKRLAGGGPHMEISYKDHVPQADVYCSEAVGSSEHFSQKCLQLNHTEQSSSGRETVLSHKEREFEALRRENQDLKAKLAEEVSRMRYFITGQKSNVLSPGTAELSASETETMLREKENEVQRLKKEISCLQEEVQSLLKERNAARRVL